MTSVLISIVVPLLVYLLLPTLVEKITGRKVVGKPLLVIAGLLFFISYYLPSPEIEGKDTMFITHFIGGGIFSGFVWLFLTRQFSTRLTSITELISLYLVVSGLGVANEIAELLIVKAGLINIDPADTWWDLVANTSGAFVFWIFYRLFLRQKNGN